MGAHDQVAHASQPPVRFETHPDRYRHWRLELVDSSLAGASK
jgi:hypothetical protein